MYVSRSKLEPANGDEAVQAIVRIAQARNAVLGITGALVSTGSCFAQVIEGPPPALDQLMASILNDPRHSDVRVVSTIGIEERRFGDWWMAYSGPSIYVNRHIKPLLDDGADQRDTTVRAERLSALMREFTAPR
jgi:hypothetical protein